MIIECILYSESGDNGDFQIRSDYYDQDKS